MNKDNFPKATGAAPFQATDYIEVAEWSDEDHCYIGSVPPLVEPSCDKSLVDIAALFCELDEIAKERLDILVEDGFPIPPPLEAATYRVQFIQSAGKHILRCRLLDASRKVVSDGMFQNEGGVHRPCFMPLPRISPLDDAARSQGAFLRFSSTLIVPIEGLKPLGKGAFEVVGFHEDASEGKVSEKALHLI